MIQLLPQPAFSLQKGLILHNYYFFIFALDLIKKCLPFKPEYQEIIKNIRRAFLNYQSFYYNSINVQTAGIFNQMNDDYQQKKISTHNYPSYTLQQTIKQSIKATNFIIDSTTTQIQFQLLLKRYFSYQNNTGMQKKDSSKTDENRKLIRPPMGQSKFFNIWSSCQQVRGIMVKAYKQEELKLSQFQILQKYFKLSQKQIKMMNYLDQMILQTLRFAIYNNQLIPQSMVKVIVQMAKTNLVKQWEDGYSLLTYILTNEIISLDFQPPLDLYIEFIDSGLIKPSDSELNEVFNRNQFMFKKFSDKKQSYSTPDKKKRLIYYQFPYLLDIYDKINSRDPTGYNFGGLKLYINTVLTFLEIPDENYLVERYLPEVKCRYLKIKKNLNDTDFQFLFTALKKIEELDSDDFKILYPTKPNSAAQVKEIKVKSWSQFRQIQQLCNRLLTDKQFHVSTKQLQQLGAILNFQQAYSIQLVKINFIFTIFREQSFSHQQLSLPLIGNILWILRVMPDKRRRKQCCYILICQYFRLIDKLDEQQRAQIVKKYRFPQRQLDVILDEGRQIALDILLSEKQNNLTFDKDKYKKYLEIVQSLVNDTKYRTIRRKAIELYSKLIKVSQFRNKDFRYYQENVFQENELIQFLESSTKNSAKISAQCVSDIIKVLLMNSKPSIRKSCLSTLHYVVNNIQIGQPTPDRFQETTIKLIIHIYNDPKTNTECRNQILKLAIGLTDIPNSYALLDILVMFFLKLFNSTAANTYLNTNSSFAICQMALKFKQKSQRNYPLAKQFLSGFVRKSLKYYGNDFQLNSQGSLNILCAIVALAKNQILLPLQLIQQMTEIALKYRQVAELALSGVLLWMAIPKSEEITQKGLLNLCQILKQNKNREMLAVQILQKYSERHYRFPESVKQRIGQLTKAKKCGSGAGQRLYNLYRNKIRRRQL